MSVDMKKDVSAVSPSRGGNVSRYVCFLACAVFLSLWQERGAKAIAVLSSSSLSFLRRAHIAGGKHGPRSSANSWVVA